MQNFKIVSDILSVFNKAGVEFEEQKRKETINEFKLRILLEVNELDDDSYDSLEQESRDWIEASISAIEDNRADKDIKDIDLPLFPEESTPTDLTS